MPEMWDAPTEPGAFALPGDDEMYGGPPAEQEPAQEETPAEETPAEEGRARNPDGTFAPATAEGGTDTPAEPEDPALAWARERIGEEVTPKVAKMMWHQEQHAARQGTEIGELRKAVQELPSQIQPQFVAPPQYDRLLQQEDDYGNPNYMAAAEAALNAGDMDNLGHIHEAWKAAAPTEAVLWSRQKNSELQMQQVQEQLNRQVADQAYAQFSRSHPDVEDYSAQMTEVLRNAPHLRSLIESGDPQAKVEVLDYAYTKAKEQQARGDADNLASALRNSAQDVARAEEEAAVVSTTRTTEPEGPSEAEQIAQPWLDRQRPFDEGWNIQSG